MKKEDCGAGPVVKAKRPINHQQWPQHIKQEGEEDQAHDHRPPPRRRVVRVPSGPTSFICLLCRKLKIKCDRQFPCGRCFRLGHQCRPPPEYLEVAAGCSTACSSSSSSSSDSSHSPLLLELSIKTINMLQFADEFMTLFHERLALGQICRKRVIRMLKTYRETSRRCGKDVTLGIAEGCSQAMGITPWELEAGHEMQYDHLAGLPQVLAREKAALQTLRNSSLYQLASATAGGEGSAFLISALVNESFVFLSSGSSSGRTIYSATDVYAIRGAHDLLVMLIFGCVIFADDRKHWWSLTLDTLYANDHINSCSRLIKVLNREGDICIYLFSARRLPCHELGVDCMVTFVEPAPNSTYVVEMPDHPHRILKRLRGSTYQPDPLADGDEGAIRVPPPPPSPLSSSDLIEGPVTTTSPDSSLAPSAQATTLSSSSRRRRKAAAPGGVAPAAAAASSAAGCCEEDRIDRQTQILKPSNAGAAWLSTDPATLAVLPDQQSDPRRRLPLLPAIANVITSLEAVETSAALGEKVDAFFLPSSEAPPTEANGIDRSNGHRSSNDDNLTIKSASTSSLSSFDAGGAQEEEEEEVEENDIFFSLMDSGEVPVFDEAQLENTFE